MCDEYMVEINDLDEFCVFFMLKNVNQLEIYGGFVICLMVDCLEVEEVFKLFKVIICCLFFEQEECFDCCLFIGREMIKWVIFVKLY